MNSSTIRRPSWLKVSPFSGDGYQKVAGRLRRLSLKTVCEEANCPNRGECFNEGTATFLLMGATCTRNCSFCDISTGKPAPLDILEPRRVAQMAYELELKHVVITSVNRDDLPDQGSNHFAETIREINKVLPKATTEILTPDFQGREQFIDVALNAGPTVFNHNVETVPRLYREVRPGSVYRRSLNVLAYAAQKFPHIKTKSGIMMGLGETFEEVVGVFYDLKQAGVRIVTVGQYLRPSKDHIALKKYWSPEEFKALELEATKAGIPVVVSGPLVRSSYHAQAALDV